MGVDTKGRLLGHVKPEEIINYIYNNWDKNIERNIRIEHDDVDAFSMRNYLKEVYDENTYIERGHIYFNYKGEDVGLFYLYHSYNTYEDLEYYKKYGLDYMVKSEVTYISLWESAMSEEIMNELVSHFGGWINNSKWSNFDDSDDKPYYYIESTESDRKVIYMTQEELNNHFGGIVVIKEN